MKPSVRTVGKGGRDLLWAIVAIIAWVIDGDTTSLLGSLNVPPESTAALLVVLLFAHRYIRDDILQWWKRRKAYAPPPM